MTDTPDTGLHELGGWAVPKSRHRWRLTVLCLLPLVPGCLLVAQDRLPCGTVELPPPGPLDVSAAARLGPATAPPPAAGDLPPRQPGERLQIPPELPGANTPPIRLPTGEASRAER